MQTHLASLSGMINSPALHTIKSGVITGEDAQVKLGQVGTPKNIIIHSDAENAQWKIANGIYGKKINILDISNSTMATVKYGNYTNAQSTLGFVRNDMYNDHSKPLFNSGDYTELAVAKSGKAVMYDTRITAYECHPIPSIGVGDKVNLIVPKNVVGAGVDRKYSGEYIINTIMHVIDDGDYLQTIELIRGGEE